MADNSIKNTIRALENAFTQDVDFHRDENVAHLFETICNYLKDIATIPDFYSTEQKYQLVQDMKSFRINLFHQMVVRFTSTIPPQLVKTVFDMILYQIQIEMEVNEIVNDSYFDWSLSCLTADVTLDYLHAARPVTSIDEDLLHLFCAIGNWGMINKIQKSNSISVTRKNRPTFFELNHETDRLLRGFLTYLNRHFRENPITRTQRKVFWWIHSVMDIITFVPFFVTTGYAEMALHWLSIESNEPMISMSTWRENLDIVHNLARHESGVIALNELNAISVLKTWKHRYLSDSTLFNDEDDQGILVIYYMSYALLLEPSVLKEEDATSIRLALDHILERAIQAFRSPSLRCGVYHVTEFWAALAKFAVNDECLLYMLTRENVFEFLLQKFLEFNQFSVHDSKVDSSDLNLLICSLLYTMFWSISFQSNYHTALKTNAEFVRFIQQTAKLDSRDEYTANMKRSANGILFNLDLDQQNIVQCESKYEENFHGVKLMISYSHKDSLFCRQIVNTLKDRVQGDVWVDFIKLQPPYEDDWEEIAEAITNCDVVVMIVTANYCSSKSCRREVIHADKRNKRMIPVYAGEEYQPDDWFEIRAGSATWVRFNSIKSDEDVMETLITLINSQQITKKRMDVAVDSKRLQYTCDDHVPLTSVSSPIVQIPSSQPLYSAPLLTDFVALTPTITSSGSTFSKPVEQWTGDEVQKWLRLPSSVLQLSSGYALLTYARLISDEHTQRDEYERNLRDRGVTREQWANLICSLTTLPISQNQKPWSSDEVKCWFEHHNIPHYFQEVFSFVDGMDLAIYAKMMIASSSCVISEYHRLKTRVQVRNNGQDLLQLDDYTRFVRALEKLAASSQIPFNI